MKIELTPLAPWIKDGKRFRLTPDEGEVVRDWAEVNGYALEPLTPEQLKAAIAAQQEVKQAEAKAKQEAKLAEIAAKRAAIQAAIVPSEVPLWAFRATLSEDNLLQAVKAAVAGSAVLTEFLEYGNFVERKSPTLAALASQLGKTEADVDELFRRAKSKKL